MSNRTCSYPDCDRPHAGRGFCTKHLQRLQRTGSPELRRSPTADERFWANVDKTETCWLWTAYIKPNGYATFYVGADRGGDKLYVHRVSYEMHKGPIPDGLDIDHLCRVRHCVNPDHLEAVTHRENMLRGETVASFNARKTHGPEGHLIDGVLENGHRFCSTCKPGRGKGHRSRTHCKHGHPFDEANTYWPPDGKGRACKTCRAQRSAASYRRRAMTQQIP